MLGAGCATGALAGVYGQLVIDGYLKRVAGFPVAGVASAQRPIEILALVVAAVLGIVAVPSWIAAKAPPPSRSATSQPNSLAIRNTLGS